MGEDAGVLWSWGQREVGSVELQVIRRCPNTLLLAPWVIQSWPYVLHCTVYGDGVSRDEVAVSTIQKMLTLRGARGGRVLCTSLATWTLSV